MTAERWCRTPGCNEPPLYSEHWCRKHAGGGQKVVQPANTELGRAANVARTFDRQLRDSHAPWQEALSVDCPVHEDGTRGRYCYGKYPRAVCQARVSAGLAQAARR